MNNLIVIIGIILLCAIGLGFWMWFMERIGVLEEEKRDMFGRIIHKKDKK